MNWHTPLLPVAACCLAFLPSAACAEETIRVSVSGLRNLQADDTSGSPSISADGQRIAFDSSATSLISNYSGATQQVYLRTEGVKILGGTFGLTALVSVSIHGTPGNAPSYQSSLSADGQYVAFASGATDLVPNDTNAKADIFVRDLREQTTSIVSISSSGARGDGDSGEPSISADGRFIAFTSEAGSLVPGDFNDATDVFVRDTRDGITTRVSIASDGTPGERNSRSPSISADGRFVAFSSLASGIMPGAPRDIFEQVHVRDLMTATTTHVSASPSGAMANGNCLSPSISADGRYIAFTSSATNLGPPKTRAVYDIYVRDRVAGTTTRVSVPFAGEANGNSWDPSISADGRYVAFMSGASNLVPGDFNGEEDVFVRDMVAGTTRRVSISSSGGQANQNSWPPVISADGRFVAFDSYASNLVPNDTNDAKDVFRHGPLFALPYTMQDAAQALRIAGGMVNPSPAVAERLDAVSASPGVDLRDAVSIARKVAGLEANPG